MSLRDSQKSVVAMDGPIPRPSISSCTEEGSLIVSNDAIKEICNSVPSYSPSAVLSFMKSCTSHVASKKSKLKIRMLLSNQFLLSSCLGGIVPKVILSTFDRLLNACFPNALVVDLDKLLNPTRFPEFFGDLSALRIPLRKASPTLEDLKGLLLSMVNAHGMDAYVISSMKYVVHDICSTLQGEGNAVILSSHNAFWISNFASCIKRDAMKDLVCKIIDAFKDLWPSPSDWNDLGAVVALVDGFRDAHGRKRRKRN